MFDVKYKPAENGKLSKSLRLHAATIRKLRFCSHCAEMLMEAYPAVAGHCEDLGHAVGAILAAAGGTVDSSDAPEEPTDIASELDEATEAKLDEIAPRKSAG